MAVRQVRDVTSYLELLSREPAEVQALYDDLLIKVTSFFREEGSFDELRQIAFPEILKILSIYNPMTLLITGIRYFAIGPDFIALGKHYQYAQSDILTAYLGLMAFAALTFGLAWWRFQKAVVT